MSSTSTAVDVEWFPTMQAVEAPQDSSSSTPRRAKRTPGKYEQPTPEKLAYGLRMRRAREAAGMSLTEAATALGYSQPVQLSLMEAGRRLPTLNAITQLARLYGTTADYLVGFVAGMDRDPAVTAEALVASRVTADVRRLISSLVKCGQSVVRDVRPDRGRMLRLAGASLEVLTALERVRQENPGFDDLKCGATLLCKAEVAAGLAREHVESVERARRMLKQAQPDDTSFATLDLADSEGGVVAAAFWPPRPVEPGALDPEPEDLEDDRWDEKAS